MFCLFLVCCQALLFSINKQSSLLLLLLVLLPGITLGVLWHLWERPENLFRGWVNQRLSTAQAGFMLFFFYLIFYLVLISSVVSYPVGWLIEQLWGAVDLSREYMLYSANLVFILAAISWGRWWRIAVTR